VSVLKIHLTYQCTAQCMHCRFGCDPSPQPVIDPDLALTCVRALRADNDLQLVVLMGGEPGLFPELTHGLAGDGVLICAPVSPSRCRETDRRPWYLPNLHKPG